jgi:hypothetical protein
VLPTVYAIDDPPVVRSSKLTNKTNEIIRDNGIRGLARTKKKAVKNKIPKRAQPKAVGVSLLSQARANLAVEDKTPRSSIVLWVAEHIFDGGYGRRGSESGLCSPEATNVARIPASEPPQGSGLSDVIDMNGLSRSLLHTRSTSGERNIEPPRWQYPAHLLPPPTRSTYPPPLFSATTITAITTAHIFNGEPAHRLPPTPSRPAHKARPLSKFWSSVPMRCGKSGIHAPYGACIVY